MYLVASLQVITLKSMTQYDRDIVLFRQLWTTVFSGLYGMVTGVLAIVIPISFHLGIGFSKTIFYNDVSLSYSHGYIINRIVSVLLCCIPLRIC